MKIVIHEELEYIQKKAKQSLTYPIKMTPSGEPQDPIQSVSKYGNSDNKPGHEYEAALNLKGDDKKDNSKSKNE